MKIVIEYCRACALCAFILLTAFNHATVFADELSAIKGRVSDVEGRDVKGAQVYVYDSPDVRRSANFMSTPTDSEGRFHMLLPAGSYWAIARLKKSEGYGPLMPGDKHSGEPVTINLAPGQEAAMDFIVADLKEAKHQKTLDREGPVKLSGRIIDEKGAPLMNVYALANRSAKIEKIPDYLSAWVDGEGRYTLYLPRGKYYLGSAVTFPPGQTYFLTGEITIESDKADLDIVWKSRSK